MEQYSLQPKVTKFTPIFYEIEFRSHCNKTCFSVSQLSNPKRLVFVLGKPFQTILAYFGARSGAYPKFLIIRLK